MVDIFGILLLFIGDKICHATRKPIDSCYLLFKLIYLTSIRNNQSRSMSASRNMYQSSQRVCGKVLKAEAAHLTRYFWYERPSLYHYIPLFFLWGGVV